MTTADMAMRMDPAYGAISKRFHETQMNSPTHSRGSAMPAIQTPAVILAKRFGGGITLAGAAGGRPLVDRRSGRDRSESVNSEDGWVCVRSRDDGEHPHLYSRFGHARRCKRIRIRLVPQKDWAVNRPTVGHCTGGFGRRAVCLQ